MARTCGAASLLLLLSWLVLDLLPRPYEAATDTDRPLLWSSESEDRLQAVLREAALADSAGPRETVYLLRPIDRPPPPGAVARVAGDPVGVSPEQWPRFEDRPMQHLVTLDLQEMPALRPSVPPRTRAVALFVSDAWDNGAWEPGTPETAVLLLTDGDLAEEHGPPLAEPVRRAYTFGVEPVEVPAAVYADPTGPPDELEALWGALFDVGARAGGRPIWLQGGGDHDPLLLQFDETFLEMNLGDAGIMYAFAETAFWECH